MATQQEKAAERAAIEQRERAELDAAAAGNAPPAGDKQPPAVARAARAVAETRDEEQQLRARIAELEAERAAAVSDAATAEAERQREAQAKAQAELREAAKDETVPGGRFLVGNILVNANGEPLAE